MTYEAPEGAVSDVEVEASTEYRWIPDVTDDAGPLGREFEWVKATHADDVPFYRLLPFAPTRILAEDGYVHFVLNGILDLPNRRLHQAFRDAVKHMRAMEDPHLVLDLRNSWGGNGCLLPQVMQVMTENSDLFNDGRFYVLISRNTFSASINLVTLLETYTDAVFVGEPTGESPNFRGDRQRHMLPDNKLVFSMSNVKHSR